MNDELKAQVANTVLSKTVEATAHILEKTYEFGPVGVVILAHDGKTCYANTNMGEAETLAILEGMITLWKAQS